MIHSTHHTIPHLIITYYTTALHHTTPHSTPTLSPPSHYTLPHPTRHPFPSTSIHLTPPHSTFALFPPLPFTTLYSTLALSDWIQLCHNRLHYKTFSEKLYRSWGTNDQVSTSAVLYCVRALFYLCVFNIIYSIDLFNMFAYFSPWV